MAQSGVGSLIFIMASLLAPIHWSTVHIQDLWLLALVIIGAFAARAAVLFGLIAVLSDLQLSRPMSMPPTSWRSRGTKQDRSALRSQRFETRLRRPPEN
jgi:hypothetical protein